MNCLLDTNIIIDHFRGTKPIPKKVIENDVAICIISLGELIYGAYRSTNTKKSLQVIDSFISEFGVKVLPVEEEVIIEFAKLKALLENRGKRLEDFDLLIAATAITYSLTLATRDAKHFMRIAGLKIIS